MQCPNYLVKDTHYRAVPECWLAILDKIRAYTPRERRLEDCPRHVTSSKRSRSLDPMSVSIPLFDNAETHLEVVLGIPSDDVNNRSYRDQMRASKSTSEFREASTIPSAASA